MPTATQASEPRYTIEANSLEDLMAQCAEAILKTQPIDVIKAKKGNGVYGQFRFEIEGHDKELALKGERGGKSLFPIGVTAQFIWHKLSDEKTYEAEYVKTQARKQERQAASIANITDVEALRTRLEELQRRS